MRFLRPTLLLSTLALFACAPAAPPTAPAPAAITLEQAAAIITAEDIHAHIAFLASDEMRGRDTPSPELERAAEYLEEQFRAYGLQPAGEEGTFIQRFPFTAVTLQRGALSFGSVSPRGRINWEYGRDYFVIPSPVDSAVAQPVYVGTIAQAARGLPETVRDRVVLVCRPGGRSAQLLQAIQAAERAGAAGFVMILDPQFPAEAISQFVMAIEMGAVGVQPIPTFGLRYENAREMFRAADLDLDELRRRQPEVTPVVVELPGTTMALHGRAEIEEHWPPNVAAMLPGSDPALRDSYVILTAHFDHVGVGEPDATGDSIYNGADDNASGTAALLAVARAFGALPQAPARSIIFLAVSGEEKGLLGSAYYAENPTVPLEGIIANINLDMVGRNHPDSVVVIGEDFTTLGPLTHRIIAERPELGLVLAPDPDPAEQVFFRSDHFSFARQGIPAIFFTTWLHEDYHRPSDTVEKIDNDKTARIARMVFYLTSAIAEEAATPEWTEEGIATMRAVGAQ